MAKVTKRMFEEEETSYRSIRINKYLSDSGVCSRREADLHVENGDVTIDGQVAVMGSKVSPYQTVVFCGKEIERDDKMVLIALNKPQGIVCTTDNKDPDNIVDFLKYGKRIYPIGRLDKDSEGLILLTNNGDIVNKILRAGNHHEKEYIVTVNKALTSEFIKGMSNGVPILNTVTRPCSIEAIDKTSFRIILTQGLNRQIRRMCEYFGYNVIRLQRIRIMNIRLGHLQLGGYRNLTDYELEELKELMQDSDNQPMMGDLEEETQDVHVSDKNIHAKNTKTAGAKKKEYKGRNFASSKDSQRDYKGSKPNFKDKETRYSKDNSKDKETRYSKDNSKDKEKRYSRDNTENKGYKSFGNGKKDDSKDSTRGNFGKLSQKSYSDKSGRPEQRSYSDKSGRPEQRSYSDKSGRPEQRSYSDKSGRPEQRSYSDKSGRPEQRSFSDKSGRPEQRSYSDKSGRPEQRSFSNKSGRPAQKSFSDKSGKPSYSSSGTTRTAAKDKSQGYKSVNQGKKEYSNAGQKTTNYRTNRTSR